MAFGEAFTGTINLYKEASVDISKPLIPTYLSSSLETSSQSLRSYDPIDIPCRCSPTRRKSRLH